MTGSCAYQFPACDREGFTTYECIFPHERVCRKRFLNPMSKIRRGAGGPRRSPNCVLAAFWREAVDKGVEKRDLFIIINNIHVLFKAFDWRPSKDLSTACGYRYPQADVS